MSDVLVFKFFFFFNNYTTPNVQHRRVRINGRCKNCETNGFVRRVDILLFDQNRYFFFF